MAVCSVLGALLFAAPAQARPCADQVDVRVKGISHIVYTGDGRYERKNLPCSKARRIAKEAMRGKKVSGWKCRNRRSPYSRGWTGRCVRGGTYVDEYGHTQWRYLVAWYPYQPH